MIGNVENLRLMISNLQGAANDMEAETPEETEALEELDDALMRVDGLFSP